MAPGVSQKIRTLREDILAVRSVVVLWVNKQTNDPPKNGVTPKLPSEVAQCL